LVSASLPSIEQVIKEDGIYDSTHYFFINYIHKMVQGFIGSLDDIESSVKLSQDKDLRKIQVQLLSNIASGFDKCKFIKDNHGMPFEDDLNSSSNPLFGSHSSAPKKIHNDQAMINQVTQMGFTRDQARRALKITGDVNTAITFILENEGGLNEIAISDEEDQAKEEEKRKKEEEERQKEIEKKKQEEAHQAKLKSLISVNDFKEFLKTL